MSNSDVTQILTELSVAKNRAQTSEKLLPVVYSALRRLAQTRLRQERSGQTLQATALVHEAYLRLVDTDHQQRWDSRRHFYAAASEAMRRILIEAARYKQTAKRGGDWVQKPIETIDVAAPESEVDLLALDDVLSRLESEYELAAMLVKLRYFSGLTITQAAKVLDLSKRSTERLWTFAKAWLLRELGDERQ